MLNPHLSKLLSTRAVWAVAIGALAIAGVASGQAHRPDATLDELVVEVQALRAEMNQAAGASIRAQLLIGRLQMEDARIASVVRELELVQSELATGAPGRSETAGRLRELEEALISTSGEARADVERELNAMRAVSQQSDRRVELLKRRESGLGRELEEDQARWSQINAQLENVEQAIPGRSQ
jgi:chromosome segregation ATPase